jgi:uncharacterized membrane protein (DUF373 family)
MKIFKKVIDLIIKLMLPLVVLTLVMGIVRIFIDLKSVFYSSTVSDGFDIMITNILSMFVVIELLRSVVDYFKIHRLRVTFIADAALVFILREVMISVYKNTVDPMHIAALSLLILVIGVVRTLAIIYSPEKNLKK